MAITTKDLQVEILEPIQGQIVPSEKNLMLSELLNRTQDWLTFITRILSKNLKIHTKKINKSNSKDSKNKKNNKRNLRSVEHNKEPGKFKRKGKDKDRDKGKGKGKGKDREKDKERDREFNKI